MSRRRVLLNPMCWVTGLVAVALVVHDGARAQGAAPQMLDPNLRVRTVASGFDLPIGLAFLAQNDMLVIEKDTGRCSVSSTAWLPAPSSTSA